MTGITHGEIRASTVLPARRSPLTLHTADGLRLVGELALPPAGPPAATLICLHPLPTEGGMMDSHLLRKAAYRLPALASLAVLRFNTRGTSSAQGTSEGEFGDGEDERLDVAAAIASAACTGLPAIWLLGWSFGTELALKWGNVDGVTGAILLSPPLRRAGDADLDGWAASGRPLVALIPELDDYLRPAQARQRFARVPQAQIVAVERAKHLWVGEPYVRIALNEIVRRVNLAAWPLPTHWADDRRRAAHAYSQHPEPAGWPGPDEPPRAAEPARSTHGKDVR
jgi:alpha/beta superfamily hydrolase